LKNTVIILGSSRSDGDTAQVCHKLKDQIDCDIIDLKEYEISYYDYQHKNKSDDFIPIIRRILTEYQTIILATPVYWYTMSGIMKVFIDRFSDLLTIEKDLGRKLRGKNLGVLSCSLHSEVDQAFWIPFKKSAAYLGMNYLGNCHFADVACQEGYDEFAKLLTGQ